MHDADFRQAEKDWHSFVGAVSEHLTEIDDTVPELPVKDVVSPTGRVWCSMQDSSAHHIPLYIRFSASTGMLGLAQTRLPTRYDGAGSQQPRLTLCTF